MPYVPGALRQRLFTVALLCSLALPAAAQETPAPPNPPSSPVLTIDRERLFSESTFGKASIAGIEANIRALQTENQKIEADLEAEEKSLTERRKDMTADEFRVLAQAFDAKVQGIRSARDAKGRELVAQQDAARQKFLEAAVPLLARIMAEQGAVVIIDRSAIILSFDRVDITDLAIARIDAELGDADPANPAPASESAAPEAAPQPPQAASP